MAKTISVVMCTYNGAKYVREQLDSIVRQTYPIHELIIQDDGSTDGTVAILAEYAGRYPFIRYQVNQHQLGINRNFFSAMAQATGEFIAPSDQDDIWVDTKLETQIHSIGSALLSAGQTKPFTDDALQTPIHWDSRRPNYSLERMIYLGCLAGHTFLLRRELLELIPHLELWIDQWTWDKLLSMVAAAYEQIQFCDCILVHQRRHPAAATYIKPENYAVSPTNIWHYLRRTLHNYHTLRPFMEDYFSRIYAFLYDIQVDTPSKSRAMRLAWLQSSATHSFLLRKVRMSFYCVQYQKRLFHSQAGDGCKENLIRCLRALYYPISCSDYFRYKLAPPT